MLLLKKVAISPSSPKRLKLSKRRRAWAHDRRNVRYGDVCEKLSPNWLIFTGMTFGPADDRYPSPRMHPGAVFQEPLATESCRMNIAIQFFTF